MMKQAQPLVVDISAHSEPIVVESMCVQCGNNGQTVLLMTKIPFFKELLIGSFTCSQCGNRNNSVQFCGDLPSHAVNISFKILGPQDLNREIVKSQHAVIRFQELDLEIPKSGKAEINTIEGILMRVEEEITQSQKRRKQEDQKTFQKIEEFLLKIRAAKNGQKLPMNMKIIDPSGNSNIKNPFAPKLDHRILISYSTRTLQQLQEMGYSQDNAKLQAEAQDKKNQEESEFHRMDFNKPLDENFMNRESSVFETQCHVCMMPGLMKMCQTSIPHFSDLIIMSFSCDHCGAHTTETKNSGDAGDNCTTFMLKATSMTDLKRDLFKSETCKVEIPQIQLQLDYGTLGGAYTTVEGLLEKIKTHIGEMNSFTDSDSYFWWKIKQLTNNIEQMMEGEKPFTMILTDPLSHSFLQNPEQSNIDQNLKITVRPRNEEENDFLGFTDMSV